MNSDVTEEEEEERGEQLSLVAARTGIQPDGSGGVESLSLSLSALAALAATDDAPGSAAHHAEGEDGILSTPSTAAPCEHEEDKVEAPKVQPAKALGPYEQLKIQRQLEKRELEEREVAAREVGGKRL